MSKVIKRLVIPSKYGTAFDLAERAYWDAKRHGATGERAFEIATEAYTRQQKAEADGGMTIDAFSEEYAPTPAEREADKARHSLTESDIDAMDEAA
jgi:hypothetical protein